MQTLPDWHNVWTPEKAEKALANFKFRGAGLYLSDTDTILVAPHGGSDLLKWNAKSEKYMFLCWNNPYHKTVLGKSPPIRVDDRTHY